jgi:hypothetical protein
MTRVLAWCKSVDALGAAIDMIANPVWFGVGCLAALIGLWLYLRAGRGMVNAAWDAVKSRDIGKLGEHVGGTIKEFSADTSLSGGAKKLAGLAAREAAAHIKRMLGLVFIVGGLALAALGAFWR